MEETTTIEALTGTHVLRRWTTSGCPAASIREAHWPVTTPDRFRVTYPDGSVETHHEGDFGLVGPTVHEQERYAVRCRRVAHAEREAHRLREAEARKEAPGVHHWGTEVRRAVRKLLPAWDVRITSSEHHPGDVILRGYRLGICTGHRLRIDASLPASQVAEHFADFLRAVEGFG